MTATRCKTALQEKIRENMREWKTGRYSSKQQAVAVAYSIIGRKYPNCKRLFKR